jgi:hypothetical protein
MMTAPGGRAVAAGTRAGSAAARFGLQGQFDSQGHSAQMLPSGFQ